VLSHHIVHEKVHWASIALLLCIVVGLPFTALHYDTHDNLLLIILTGGDLERLARETEGKITVHIIAFDLLN
jgi:hypothetical protein